MKPRIYQRVPSNRKWRKKQRTERDYRHAREYYTFKVLRREGHRKTANRNRLPIRAKMVWAKDHSIYCRKKLKCSA